MKTKIQWDKPMDTRPSKSDWTDHSPGSRRGNEAEKSNLTIHFARCLAVMSLAFVMAAATGCGGGKAQKKNTDFFTSGSREADQRASQRMAKEEQLSGTGEGSGEKNVKK